MKFRPDCGLKATDTSESYTTESWRLITSVPLATTVFATLYSKQHTCIVDVKPNTKGEYPMAFKIPKSAKT